MGGSISCDVIRRCRVPGQTGRTGCRDGSCVRGHARVYGPVWICVGAVHRGEIINNALIDCEMSRLSFTQAHTHRAHTFQETHSYPTRSCVSANVWRGGWKFMKNRWVRGGGTGLIWVMPIQIYFLKIWHTGTSLQLYICAAAYLKGPTCLLLLMSRNSPTFYCGFWLDCVEVYRIMFHALQYVSVIHLLYPFPAPCEADAFFCHSNMCINNTLVCNGMQNCVYPWDENQCKGEMLLF